MGKLFNRMVVGIMLVLMLVGFVAFAFGVQRVQADAIAVPDDYLTIQEAIDHANEEDTINVRNGTYAGGLNYREG